MTTDTGSDALHVVQYLKRNDFTNICVESSMVVTANDGKRKVYVIIAPDSLSDVVLSQHLLSRARSVGARIDIIHVDASAMRHYINAVQL